MEDDWVIIVEEKRRIKEIKTAAERKGIYDKTRLITPTRDGSYAIPVSGSACQVLFSDGHASCHQRQIISPPFQGCLLIREFEKSKMKQKKDIISEMQSVVAELLGTKGLDEDEIKELVGHVPTAWIRHDDMVVLPKAPFDHPLWQTVLKSYDNKDLWKGFADVLKCKRIVLQEKVSTDRYRSPINQLVLGEDGWVTHTDNGVHYVFDATRTMFSQGNITEKIRMAKLSCSDEVVVDLFAGIGYFTLPLLVHADALYVYACEWNPVAIESLKKGLIKNKVSEKCFVLEGDNKEVAPKGVADRVILGLIPSSESSWVTGCACINPEKGGWLHIHGNVAANLKVGAPPTNDKKGLLVSLESYEGNSTDNRLKEFDPQMNDEKGACSVLPEKETYEWCCYVKAQISEIFNQLYGHQQDSLQQGTRWNIKIGHIERVKSYAPHIYHVVVDLECKPIH